MLQNDLCAKTYEARSRIRIRDTIGYGNSSTTKKNYDMNMSSLRHFIIKSLNTY